MCTTLSLVQGKRNRTVAKQCVRIESIQNSVRVPPFDCSISLACGSVNGRTKLRMYSVSVASWCWSRSEAFRLWLLPLLDTGAGAAGAGAAGAGAGLSSWAITAGTLGSLIAGFVGSSAITSSTAAAAATAGAVGSSEAGAAAAAAAAAEADGAALVEAAAVVSAASFSIACCNLHKK